MSVKMKEEMEKQITEKLVHHFSQGKWKDIIELFKSKKQDDTNDFYDERLLWVRPSEENLNFIKENVLNAGCSHLISIGCGSGLLEWLINEATGLKISGIEVDRNWWESPYAPQTFIAHLYADEETFSYSILNSGNSALMFCYFNNGDAFSEYMRHYTGNCLIVIGPGEGRGTHTCPTPFDVKFHGIDQWRLNSLQELQKTRDFIAVYLKDT